jgi:hypothetical protein
MGINSFLKRKNRMEIEIKTLETKIITKKVSVEFPVFLKYVRYNENGPGSQECYFAFMKPTDCITIELNYFYVLKFASVERNDTDICNYLQNEEYEKNNERRISVCL